MKNFIFSSLLLLASFAFSQKTASGVITSVKGKTFTIKPDSSSTIPSKGDSCYISKDISGSKNPFGINVTSGWMGVGRGIITLADKTKITVLVVKETSNIVINGKKTEHFIPGKKMKLECR